MGRKKDWKSSKERIYERVRWSNVHGELYLTHIRDALVAPIFSSFHLMRYLPFLPLVLAVPGYAFHSKLSGRLDTQSTDGLQRRTPLSGTMAQLGDSQNLVYLTNVSLNGAPFSIMIDTGRYTSPLSYAASATHHSPLASSDLWVSNSVPSASSQSFQADVSYASGSASGNNNTHCRFSLTSCIRHCHVCHLRLCWILCRLTILQ